jgi:hypothetical protein
MRETVTETKERIYRCQDAQTIKEAADFLRRLVVDGGMSIEMAAHRVACVSGIDSLLARIKATISDESFRTNVQLAKVLVEREFANKADKKPLSAFGQEIFENTDPRYKTMCKVGQSKMRGLKSIAANDKGKFKKEMLLTTHMAFCDDCRKSETQIGE